MNICLQCKEKTSNPKFCSKSCSAIFNNRKRKKPLTKCLNCGEDIGTKGYIDRKKKFCSNMCQGDYKVKETIKNNKVKDEKNTNFAIGICKIHGSTKFYKIKRNKGFRYRCGKCSAKMVSDRRRRLKLMAIEYKGGKCCKCGYNKSIRSLQFHHLDPNEKDFGIASSGHIYSWEKTKKELDKCILVCANCHGELEDEIEANKQNE